jgi:3-deoxy-7-phosphoheptulonate synthase
MIVIAGPCVVENYGTLLEIAHIIKDAGAQILRGGAYKPRTSPYAFQGLELDGLKYLRNAADETGLKVITEVMDSKDIDIISKYTDMFQIGSRNMMNYSLLKDIGKKTNKTVLLKRGFMATIEEFINASEYIKYYGNCDIMLCERGIRTFETSTRNTFDINAIPLLKLKTKMKIIADPSHGTGIRELVIPISKAAIAAGADGLMIEVHTNPNEALSDGNQSLYPEQFIRLMKEIL